MTIREALAEAGVVINHENKPAKNPTKGAFSRVIAALRQAEIDAAAELAETQKRENEALRIVGLLTEKLQKAEADLQKFRMQERLSDDAYEKLNRVEKNNLMEVVG